VLGDYRRAASTADRAAKLTEGNAEQLADAHQMIAKAGNKGFALSGGEVGSKFRSPQYRFQFLQTGMADANLELQQRFFQRQCRNGLRANGGADQDSGIEYDAPSEVHERVG